MKRFTAKEWAEVHRHYGAMLAYAVTRPPDESPLITKMRDAIGETWDGVYCYLCQQYPALDYLDCRGCPLKENNMHCQTWWPELNRASTYAEWIDRAVDFLMAIEPLKPEGYDKEEQNG